MENRKTALDIIFSGYDNFFEAEKKIANYIMNNQEKVIEMTIAELSAASGASEATISRFCKKCNMKGFHHLKISLAKEIVESKDGAIPVSNDIDEHNISQSLQNILANKIEELRQTISMINEKKFKEILDLLKNAKSVQFVAVGNTIPVALDGTFKFNQIGILAVSNTIWETQLAYTYNLTKNDIVIVISNSGASKRLMTIIEVANQQGATTIAITNNDLSPIAKASDYHITTATREKLFMDEYCFSRVSASMVIEILYLFLTVGKDHVYQNISRYELSTADDKI
ncbi:MurR/RpiR family transcriptional regulator [Clostridium estertheticum]|uniref:MurR/RpiR family transcriptional regulator n=1 Tax=Clostridium estertheticum TaxID=238834 RepID=A0AA47I7R2_9CLOT|nr:MurR/RpiR family transcriptional regulator [Clostridium estertheticum]MBU3157231.1 MurR/RpiR family transcriptional regulator [Clostridium estertheticum]MBU3200885.1 MurR/RpiR family transcriptional regulator [Clostridium estertheticum]WAG61868.1 MurR/RpiR family transcriptional regulator [Clostridium estertheticum]WAG64013.1 MurR/RpiR family transcriptional regulator [Clostridium estertheticum]